MFCKNYAFQIKDMVNINDELPQLERLDRHEFELDVEEQGQILAETDAFVQKVSWGSGEGGRPRHVLQAIRKAAWGVIGACVMPAASMSRMNITV